MLIESEGQALKVLSDIQLENEQREAAIAYISANPTPQGIKQLVTALQDEEFAVRWSASNALSHLGPMAFLEILRALVDPKLNTLWLREGVYHVLHYSSSLANIPFHLQQEEEPNIHIEPQKVVSVRELLKALKGPAADIASMEVASKLLLQLEGS
jgi:hypothetical protein